MHTNVEFDFATTATPEQVIELMTDFTPNRPHRWPTSSAKAFEVYRLGDTDADIREGQEFPKLLGHMNYDWLIPRGPSSTRAGMISGFSEETKPGSPR